MWARFFAACPGIRRVDACQDAAAEPIDVLTGRASVQFRSFAAERNRRLPEIACAPPKGTETSAVWVEGDEVMAMFVWILILSSWVALLSLILHDATKDDNDGSAISIAAKKIKAFTFWAMLKARRLRGTPSYRTSQSSRSKPPVKVVTAVNAISSSSEEIRQGGPSVNKQTPALPPKKKWWSKDRRVSMTTPELELAISEAVKKAAPGCEDFVGVIVHRKTPKSHLDPNWAIRGAKFGKAARPVADEALTTVVKRMQREFLLSED